MMKLSRQWNSNESLRHVLAYGVFILCAYTAWMRGGVYPSLQWPVALLALLLSAAVAVIPSAQFREIRSRVLRDPVVYGGTALLLLLLLQWANGGYSVVDNAGASVLSRTPPWWFPWSVDRLDAAEMLIWFFPAVVVVVFVRNILSRKEIKTLLYLLVWNSALLAGAGILQHLFGEKSILGIWPETRSDSFAVFDYPNHAAAWFYLHAALAAGLACDAEMKRKPRIRVVVFSLCFLCCIAACCLTLSRYGALIAMAQLSVVFILLLLETRRSLRGAKAFNAYVFLAILVLTGSALIFGAGGGGLAKELAGKSLLGNRSIVTDLSARAVHVEATAKIIAEFPLFGCGGWGCDQLAGQYLRNDEIASWMVGGRVNVHCDPVQFLAEFGVIGIICITAILALLVQGMVSARRSLLFLWVLGGLLAVLLHSLIDLPFRCPAILLAWCCLAAGLPRVVKGAHGPRKEG